MESGQGYRISHSIASIVLTRRELARFSVVSFFQLKCCQIQVVPTDRLVRRYVPVCPVQVAAISIIVSFVPFRHRGHPGHFAVAFDSQTSKHSENGLMIRFFEFVHSHAHTHWLAIST